MEALFLIRANEQTRPNIFGIIKNMRLHCHIPGCNRYTYGQVSGTCAQHTHAEGPNMAVGWQYTLKNPQQFYNFCMKTHQTQEEVLMFMSDINQINKIFNNFDLKYYPIKSVVKCTSQSSLNGFVRFLTCNIPINGSPTNKSGSLYIPIPFVLKNSRKADADNLYWEYMAGQIVNVFVSVTPFFVKTYGCYQYDSQKSYQTLLNACLRGLPHDNGTSTTTFSNYAHKITPSDAALIYSCEAATKHCLLTQTVPNALSLDGFIRKYLIRDYQDLVSRLSGNIMPPEYIGFNFVSDDGIQGMTTYIGILQMVFACLSLFGGVFTHYDLHNDNILLWTVPSNKYIEVHYEWERHKRISFKTKYLPIIIDYGKSYFMLDDVHNSKTVTDTIHLKKQAVQCADNGYGWAIDNGNTGYIQSAQNNISHDMRCLESVWNLNPSLFLKPPPPTNGSKKMEYIYESQHFVNNRITHIASFFELLIQLNYDTEYGTPNKETSQHVRGRQRTSGVVANVYHASAILNRIMGTPDFIYNNNKYIPTNPNNKYGDLIIYLGVIKPYDFIPFNSGHPAI